MTKDNSHSPSPLFSRSKWVVILVLSIPVFLSSCREPEMPKGYALIYGITQYEIGWSGFLPGYGLSDLEVTDDDAIGVAEMLRDRGWEVKLRLDDGTGSQEGWDLEAADITTFQSDINELAELMGTEDRFLFYFSGHGYDSTLGGEGESNEPEAGVPGDDWIFLYAENTDWDTELWSDYTLNDDALGQEISKLPNRIKLVVLDNCNSGGFIGTNPGVDSLPPDYRQFEDDNYDGGSAGAAVQTWLNFPDASDADILASEAIVMTASGESESSFEDSSIGHGIFSLYLLETPEKSDFNNDGWITVSEAYKYCFDEIDENWNGDQTAYNDNSYLPHLSGSPLDFVLFAAD